jgi:hypothetical protein
MEMDISKNLYNEFSGGGHNEENQVEDGHTAGVPVEEGHTAVFRAQETTYRWYLEEEGILEKLSWNRGIGRHKTEGHIVGKNKMGMDIPKSIPRNWKRHDERQNKWRQPIGRNGDTEEQKLCWKGHTEDRRGRATEEKKLEGSDILKTDKWRGRTHWRERTGGVGHTEEEWTEEERSEGEDTLKRNKWREKTYCATQWGGMDTLKRNKWRVRTYCRYDTGERTYWREVEGSDIL